MKDFDDTRRGLTRWCRKVGGHLADLLAPPLCPLCGISVSPRDRCHLCASCRLSLRQPLAWCRRCGLPEPPSGCPCQPNVGSRFDCMLPPLGRYADLLRSTIVRMKQPHAHPLIWHVGSYWWSTIEGALLAESLDLLVPVPKHWRRRIRAQQHAAELLSESLAYHARLAHDPSVLKLQYLPQKQSLLPRVARLRNLHGAMAITSGSSVVGKRVGVVDDIMTTGATLNESARVLHAAGARHVVALVVARATSRRSATPHSAVGSTS